MLKVVVCDDEENILKDIADIVDNKIAVNLYEKLGLKNCIHIGIEENRVR